MPAKILAFAGSTRTESWNKKLIRVAAEGARAEGAEVTLVDLRDFPMPLYDGDLDQLLVPRVGAGAAGEREDLGGHVILR